MLDWTLLRSFLAVVDMGSLSAAADRLGLSQPTVGRHVRELEDALGATLFRRQPRGLDPTPAALDLVEDARRMGEAADALARKASGASDHLAGTVRVTASRMVSTYLLPDIVAAMRIAAPDIDIEIVASDETQNLLRRDADIALRMYEPRQAQLVRRRIADIPLAVYASPAYLPGAAHRPDWPTSSITTSSATTGPTTSCKASPASACRCRANGSRSAATTTSSAGRW